MLSALREQGLLLVRAIGHGDAEERLAVQLALEEITNVRGRWLRHAAGLGPADDLLLDVYQAALPALAEATADKDTRVRRSAIEVLEGLGTAATPTAPALAAALDDTDRFVRWSAAVRCANIGPERFRRAVTCPVWPACSKIPTSMCVSPRPAPWNSSRRLRRSALGVQPATHAPGRLSPFARTALPPLLRSLRSDDTTIRSAAMRTLRGLGSEARLAVPAAARAATDRSELVHS